MSVSSSASEPRFRDAVSNDAQITLAQERALLTLLSGQTQRWHIHPFMPQQNVADHAWHVAAILGLFDPNCAVEDLKTALFRDVAELKHGDLSAVLKRADLELARSREEQESETLRRWTGHEATYSPAMKIADKPTDLWLLAIQSRLGNQEASTGFAKHRWWLDAMDLNQFPAAVTLRDAIECWCMYGSTILQEEIT